MTIYRNSALCLKCYEHLISGHRHNYKTCKCGATSIDGGLEYQKFRGLTFLDTSITERNSFEQIREGFEWGSYGKDGKGDLKYIKLSQLEDGHIEAILETQSNLQEFIKKLFIDEQVFRLQRKIEKLKSIYENNS